MTELTATTAEGMQITVRLPDTHTWVRESLEKACAAEARRQLGAAPTPRVNALKFRGAILASEGIFATRRTAWFWGSQNSKGPFENVEAHGQI